MERSVEGAAMITRADYMANSALHHAYYVEIAKDLGIKIRDARLIAECRAALASGDKHLNTIPLGRWDAMAVSRNPLSKEEWAKLRARGASWGLHEGVCTYKAAAKEACKTTT
jgi:hypothetical protein